MWGQNLHHKIPALDNSKFFFKARSGYWFREGTAIAINANVRSQFPDVPPYLINNFSRSSCPQRQPETTRCMVKIS